MIKKVALAFILPFVVSCNSAKKNKDISDFFPEKTAVILKINNLESLQSAIKNNDLFQLISNSEEIKQFTKKMKPLLQLSPNNTFYLCLQNNEKDSLDFTLLTKLKHIQFKTTDTLTNFNNKKISAYTFAANKKLYHVLQDSILIVSSNKNSIKNALKNKTNNGVVKSILKTANANNNLSVFINNDSDFHFKNIQITDSIPYSLFTDYTLLDTEINNNTILFNGITKAADSSKKIVSVFKNTTAQQNTIAKITPNNADGFLSITFNNFSVFNKNLQALYATDTLQNNFNLFQYCKEIGVIYQNKNRAVILHSADQIETDNALLNEQNIAQIYRENNIYTFGNPTLFNSVLKPIVLFKEAKFYTKIDSFYVFGNSIETIQNIIVNYQNNTTISSLNQFQDIQQSLASASSLLLVFNSETLSKKLKSTFNNLTANLNNYKWSALQFSFDTNFAHVNGVIKKSIPTISKQTVQETFTTKINHDLLNTPQFVTNALTKQKEILVQDIKNNLYLISNTGKVIWKKQLKQAIIGKIHQIDMYKNGKLQYAFVTKNTLEVLDSKGNPVAPFPLKFKDDITQALSVFDYDNNKKYRLLVTQNNQLYMYDAKGKQVKGFTFKQAAETINCPPEHIRIQTKDYITVKTNNKLYILNRKGKTRVAPGKNLTYSNQPVYNYQNTFTTTTGDGKIVNINTNGKINYTNLKLDPKHYLSTTNKTLAALNQNKLTINTKTIELDFGNYTPPKIFYMQNKIYVSVTDLQSHKVYVFDGNAKLLPNFPVYGNSSIALANTNNNKHIEFVTKGESNNIILYTIQ